jgi:hypothetical protein
MYSKFPYIENPGINSCNGVENKGLSEKKTLKSLLEMPGIL